MTRSSLTYHLNDDESYDISVSVMNALIEDIGDDESHLLAELLLIFSDMVSLYAEFHNPIRVHNPIKELLSTRV